MDTNKEMGEVEPCFVIHNYDLKILKYYNVIFRELMLVADALRLGGAIIGQYPDMLAPQLVGRLLPEAPTNPAVAALLKECHDKGKSHCALLPLHHCLHTPGGPLKVWFRISSRQCWLQKSIA